MRQVSGALSVAIDKDRLSKLADYYDDKYTCIHFDTVIAHTYLYILASITTTISRLFYFLYIVTHLQTLLLCHLTKERTSSSFCPTSWQAN